MIQSAASFSFYDIKDDLQNYLGFGVFDDDDEYDDDEVPLYLEELIEFQRKFENLDYASKTFIKNLGETFLIASVYIILCLIYILWTFINNRRKPENITEKGKERYKYF